MKPTEDDVVKLSSFDAGQFGNWLRTGLEGYFLDGVGLRNFDPVEHCILQEHALSGDLRIIYDALPSKPRVKFREAIALLLERLPVEEKYARIFEELLELAVAVGAHEIFRAIPARGEKFLTLERESPDIPSLYRRAFDAVLELGDQSADARQCIERLIGTPGAFSSDYATKALLALCKIAPKDFVSHMDLLRGPVAQYFEKHQPSVQAQKYLVEDIMDAVGLPSIAKNWNVLQFVEDPEGIVPNDNWFQGLMLSDLTIVQAEPNVLRVKSDPDVRVMIPSSKVRKKKRRTLWARLGTQTIIDEDKHIFSVDLENITLKQEKQVTRDMRMRLFGGSSSSAVAQGEQIKHVG